jgi:dTDP-4-dehydrorhamnose 3,5-epimerase
MATLKVESTGIPGLLIIEPPVHKDGRGFFFESYNRRDFSSIGIKDIFVQDNHSMSSRGVLRGLHFQTGTMAQSKLVRCLKGRIFDVAVDIRKGSPTFGKWAAVSLTEENKRMLYLPRGFAHGFLALADGVQVLYKTDNFYSARHESGIRWDDPELAITWPALFKSRGPVLAEKDRQLPLLKDARITFRFRERKKQQ